MTARAAMALVGRTGLWCPEAGCELRFGGQYQIAPVTGTGLRWVMAEGVTLDAAEPAMTSRPMELTA